MDFGAAIRNKPWLLRGCLIWPESMNVLATKIGGQQGRLCFKNGAHIPQMDALVELGFKSLVCYPKKIVGCWMRIDIESDFRQFLLCSYTTMSYILIYPWGEMFFLRLRSNCNPPRNCANRSCSPINHHIITYLYRMVPPSYKLVYKPIN